ncbi:MAG: hypothetical protein A3F98_00215 [Candidatus Yanofskybacteria bacterium RIFCSPLOWO2_12_FULL_41_8]|nr:MAG: hypothetical protein A3F98_00215 [Candidatus Yanofskybacteria bacterium RIFCSPLOWO2_12_FULL_41_8]
MGVMFFVILAIGLIYGYGQFGLGSNNINITNTDPTLWQKVANLFTISNEKEITIDDDPDYSIPEEEKSRQDILILGIRGEDVEDADETGAMLTDTIMVLSFDKITKKTALISIPRDLYVRIYGAKKEKINSAYEVGALRKNGLGFTKKLISRITGVYIDNVIVLDFSSFRQVIDDLGGVDINLDVPFTENQQWGYEFNLPAGLNHLDGQSALYYVRSRFSSSDFDRAQRQQNLMLAIKEKVFELNILTEPIRTLNILNTIRNNIDTDLAIWDAGGLLDIAQQFNGAEEKVKRYVITTENLVYETHIQTEVGNLYALLPIGDNLQGIKQLFQSILE